ncbi:MAG: preprotein translocase subunit SecG [Alteromonadaceae bacterium]|nr:MAG: preprotein translocase subunit SecG [Alteromonadaceae bacterium]
MENIILLVHLLTALAIIGLILLQQGKGADMGASFGSGSSQTLFGASGSGNFFSKMTGLLAALFFATSFGLAYIAQEQTKVTDDLKLPTAVEVESDLPALVDDLPVVTGGAGLVGDVPAIENESVNPSGDDLPSVGGSN